MARLIPKILVDEIPLKPERDVARALVEQLPQDCIVYHSYPWLRPERNDRTRKVILREGETDFIVVLPSHGVLVLEVKGGCIVYKSEDRLWYRQPERGELKLITDPFEQARRNTHYLIDRVRELRFGGGGDTVPFAFGYAVIFPDCKYEGPAPPGAEPIIILSASDLPYIGRRVPNVLREWNPRQDVKAIDERSLDAIQKAISPAFQLLPVLFKQIEEQEERIFRLTEDQMRLLEFLAHHERAAIEGVAGSGKTLLARAQAQRFADLRKRTLFVCFNKALAEWIRDTLPETYSNRITVQHFHALCSDWCRQAGVAFSPPPRDQNKFWKEDAAYLLLEAVQKLPDRFDAVVVDEGQDFHADWWIPLEQIAVHGEKGPMYVFYDPAQNLFGDDDKLSMPDLGKPFILPTNCRNTRRIAETCGEILGQAVATRRDAPEGVETRFINAQSEAEQRRIVEAILDEWIGKGRLKPSQIAILSPVRYRNSAAAGINGARFPITENMADWRQGRAVLFATIRAFKGLESDALVLIDVPAPDSVPYFTRSDFYVACSRAKHLLVVVRQTD